MTGSSPSRKQRRTTRFITCTTATSSNENSSSRDNLAISPFRKTARKSSRNQFKQPDWRIATQTTKYVCPRCSHAQLPLLRQKIIPGVPSGPSDHSRKRRTKPLTAGLTNRNGILQPSRIIACVPVVSVVPLTALTWKKMRSQFGRGQSPSKNEGL